VLVVLAAGLLGGCGGNGGSSASTAAVPSSPGAPTRGSAASVDAVARVTGAPIAKAGYEHWLAVERALGGNSDPSHRALGFLITSQWVLGEAAARKISVSEAEVKQGFEQIKRQGYPKAGSFAKFLSKSKETEADLLARVKIELLQSRIAAQVTAGKSAGRRSALLTSFEQAFHSHWKRYTTCDAGYVMEDCSEYRGKSEDLAATSASSSSSSGGSTARSSTSSGSISSTAGAAGASGEVYSSPGAMAISSPAFERNGAIPTQYTCDGADISPPLEWRNVPAKAAALVLFVIDDTPTGPTSGVRWIVGDIDPSSKGVAADKTPAGAIVGADTQGRPGYGGICPAHGKTSTIEFVLYALSKKIALSPGFTPATAESEYGTGKALLGSAAVTYAVYHRR
jgi:hypothetical protein